MSAGLKKLSELVEARIQTLEQEVEEANEALTRAQRDQTWTAHRSWEEGGLPVPRLEMHFECFGPADSPRVVGVDVTMLLVYRHLLGQVEAVPLGSTTRSGSWASIETAVGNLVGQPGYELPFRDGAHLIHNAAHLRLPMFATCAQLDEIYRVIDRDTQTLYDPDAPDLETSDLLSARAEGLDAPDAERDALLDRIAELEARAPLTVERLAQACDDTGRCGPSKGDAAVMAAQIMAHLGVVIPGPDRAAELWEAIDDQIVIEGEKIRNQHDGWHAAYLSAINTRAKANAIVHTALTKLASSAVPQVPQVPQPKLFGELLATVPLGTVIEYRAQGGRGWWQVRERIDGHGIDCRTCAEGWPWGTWMTGVIIVSMLSAPARVVPPDQVDAAPETRPSLGGL